MRVILSNVFFFLNMSPVQIKCEKTVVSKYAPVIKYAAFWNNRNYDERNVRVYATFYPWPYGLGRDFAHLN